MIEEPLLLPTTVGPIAAILTLPDDAPRAIVLIIPAAGGTRAGVNQVWTRFARSACESGAAVLRAEYAGLGESWDADPRERSAGIRDIARWACERTSDLPLLLVVNCFGLDPASLICRERAVAGAAVLLPPIFGARGRGALAAGPTLNDRVQTKLGQVRVLPRRVAFRVRYGSAHGTGWMEQTTYEQPIPALGELVSSTPTWLLMGSHDACTKPVHRLLPTLRERGPVEVTVIDGLMLQAQTTPEAQDAICDNIVAWVERSLSRLEEPA
jgi:alpha/beta superfamily hydrolase